VAVDLEPRLRPPLEDAAQGRRQLIQAATFRAHDGGTVAVLASQIAYPQALAHGPT
jgi:hypothetical protein